MSTDDWPFFYMPTRRYPVTYIGSVLLVMVLSALLFTGLSNQRPRAGGAPFFFMGAGFMLVETKAITELGLAFGNTWQVVGIVITGILIMAYLANCTVQWLRPTRETPWLLLLITSLAAGYLVSLNGGLGSSLGGKVAMTALLTCPMLFSGVVFSSMLRKVAEVPGAMAANLIGAMMGGVLEYNSMYFGFRFLYLLAMALYVAALATFLLSPGSGRRPALASAP